MVWSLPPVAAEGYDAYYYVVYHGWSTQFDHLSTSLLSGTRRVLYGNWYFHIIEIPTVVSLWDDAINAISMVCGSKLR